MVTLRLMRQNHKGEAVLDTQLNNNTYKSILLQNKLIRLTKPAVSRNTKTIEIPQLECIFEIMTF